MDFFREHKKLIVGLIAVSFILWTAAGLLFAIPGLIK